MGNILPLSNFIWHETDTVNAFTVIESLWFKDVVVQLKASAQLHL